jgi:hypothetical protein
LYKKLVRYDQWHYAEVDPVRLKRKAITLRDLIHQKISRDNDPYQFYSRTLPFIDAAIRGEITQSLDRDSEKFVSSSYYWNEREGTLPSEYDQDFTSAVAGFSVTAEALSLEQHEKIIKDGTTYAWLNFEEESDWPDNVKFP